MLKRKDPATTRGSVPHRCPPHGVDASHLLHFGVIYLFPGSDTGKHLSPLPKVPTCVIHRLRFRTKHPPIVWLFSLQLRCRILWGIWSALLLQQSMHLCFAVLFVDITLFVDYFFIGVVKLNLCHTDLSFRYNLLTHFALIVIKVTYLDYQFKTILFSGQLCCHCLPLTNKSEKLTETTLKILVGTSATPQLPNRCIYGRNMKILRDFKKIWLMTWTLSSVALRFIAICHF